MTHEAAGINLAIRPNVGYLVDHVCSSMMMTEVCWAYSALGLFSLLHTSAADALEKD